MASPPLPYSEEFGSLSRHCWPAMLFVGVSARNRATEDNNMTMLHAMTTSIVVALLASGAAAAYEPIVSMAGEHMRINPPGSAIDVLATREQTDGQFGAVLLLNKAGEGPGPAITHSLGSETWYVVEGTYEFHVGDRVFEGGPGTFVSVDAGQQHGHVAKTVGKLLVLFQPGGYEHFFIEWNETQVPKGPEAGALEEQYGVTRPPRP